MRVTTRGQVTIPVDIRERFGFLPDTEVEFVVQDDGVTIRRVNDPARRRGDRIMARLRGRAGSHMTTDEILNLTRRP